MKSSGPRNRLRVAGVAVAGAAVIGFAAPASADLAASQKCRGTLGKAAQTINKSVLKFIDGCHKGQNKLGEPQGACNVVTPNVAPFDPKLKYTLAIDKQRAKIDKDCLAGDPVLNNYPGGDADGSIAGLIESTLGGNAVLVLGNADLDLDKNKANCVGQIAKERAKVFNEILKESVKCQAALDKVETNENDLLGLDPSCVRTAVKAAPKSLLNIQKKCNDPGVLPGDIGVCTPLPTCVIDTTTLAAQTVASAIYGIGAPVCGNGVVEAPEQCDDANTTDADGCSSVCEVENASCADIPGAGTSVIGARTVTVSLSVPGGQKLAGVQIDVDYPQFQAGIPGTGQSQIVAGNVALLQDTTIPGDYISIANDREGDLRFVVGATEEFIDDGDLLAVTMDTCVAKETNLCNRNQNVIGCCDAATDEDSDTTFQECADFNAPPSCGSSFPTPPAVGEGGPEDCCPGDNACVTQAAATQCAVSGASDVNGVPVAGVTCTVTITGT